MVRIRVQPGFADRILLPLDTWRAEATQALPASADKAEVCAARLAVDIGYNEGGVVSRAKTGWRPAAR